MLSRRAAREQVLLDASGKRDHEALGELRCCREVLVQVTGEKCRRAEACPARSEVTGELEGLARRIGDGAVELVAAQRGAGLAEGTGRACRGGAVAEREPVSHPGVDAGEGAGHRETVERLAEQEQAAALGPSHESGADRRAELVEERPVRRQLLAEDLGKAAARVQASAARWESRVTQRVEGDELGAGLLEQGQILWIDEAERWARADGEAHSSNRTGCRGWWELADRGAARHAEQAIEIDGAVDQLREDVEGALDLGGMLSHGDQSEMALPPREPVVSGKCAENLYAKRCEGVPEQSGVAFTSDPVEDDPGNLDLGVERAKSVHERSDRSAHRRGVDDEHDGRREDSGDLGGGSGGTCTVAVEEPHNALDDEELGILTGCGGKAREEIGAVQGGVERAPGTTDGEAVVTGIDEVGSDLGCSDAHSPPVKSGHDAGRDRGLADPRVGTGDDDASAQEGHGPSLARQGPARHRASWHHDRRPEAVRAMRMLLGLQGEERLSATLEQVSARLAYLRWTLEPPGVVAPGSEPCDGDWLACDELVTTPDWLKRVVLATGRQLGTGSPAVASSLFVLGYAYRVLIFAVAGLTVGGVVPPSDAPSMAVGLARGRPSLVGYRRGGVVDLELRPDVLSHALSEPALREAALEVLFEHAIAGHLRLLVEAMTAQVRVGRRLLWGNVAASAAVAFRTMEGLLGPWVRPLGEAFFAQAPAELQGQGSFLLIEADRRHGWFWERTNCCLNDCLPQKIRCGDCSKTPVEERRAAYRKSLLSNHECC